MRPRPRLRRPVWPALLAAWLLLLPAAGAIAQEAPSDPNRPPESLVPS